MFGIYLAFCWVLLLPLYKQDRAPGLTRTADYTTNKTLLCFWHWFWSYTFDFQLIHFSTNKKCIGFMADSITHMGTVRLRARVPSPYADHSKYQSLHLNDLKEPYWLPIEHHKSRHRHWAFFLHSLVCTRAHIGLHIHVLHEIVTINLEDGFYGHGDADEVIW